ncbi:AtpZ protein [Alkalicoccobacillus plakortidis]|uniref:AtpZ protein n=2 Tax=Bacillaceae TaxID=186817 RepID=A0A9D5DTE3_9BACI|nr:AtpZ protein [Alkalicoccobacillus plakortidis]MBG9785427.1 AtpZ protein [Shouchella lehensis]
MRGAISLSKQSKNPMRAFMLVSTILSCVIGGTVGGLFLGIWLDKLLNASPVFLIICLLVGMLTSIYSISKVVQPFLGDDNEDAK